MTSIIVIFSLENLAKKEDKMRSWAILIVVIAVFSVFIVGCGKEETKPEPTPIDAPTSLLPIAYTDSIRICWAKSPQHGAEGFKGYLLYISMTDPATMSSAQLDSYKVWAEPSLDTTYLLTSYRGDSLDLNGIYYFAVRAVRTVDDRDTTSGLVITETSPVLMGMGTIFEIASDTICAFNFHNGVALRADETTPEPDFYLEDCPECGSGLALKSPHLAGTAWTGHTYFKTMGTGTLDDYPQTTDNDWSDHTDVTMRVYAIKTSSNNFVKLVITGFGGESPNRFISFKYKLQTKPFYPHF